MTEKVFVDTNILIYAHDLDAGPRHEVARAVVEDLWQRGTGVLSLQVLQEFYVIVTRKIPKPLTRPQARRLVETYAAWEVVCPGPADILRASEIEDRYRLSFWDALIVATAAKAGAQRLLTEDLSSGQLIEGVLIENPFGV